MDLTESRWAPKDEEVATVSRGGCLAIALSEGMALGAIVIAAYAYFARVPVGQTGAYLAPAGSLLLKSLLAVCVVAVVTIGLGVSGIRGRPRAGYASVLLAGTVAFAAYAYAYVSASPSDRGALISGPGARPVMAIGQASWVLLACAALLLLAGAATASAEAGQRSRRGPVVPLTAAGAVSALVVAVAVSSLSTVGTSHATTAEPVAIPAVPTSVGSKVAYALNSRTSMVLPAGPGFVLTDEQAVVAYDGTTGAQRWRFPFTDFPDRCYYSTIRSTGAMVIVQCLRPPNIEPDERRSDPERKEYESFLVGLDAVTGQRQWVNDGNWRLQGRASVDADIVAVVGPSQFGALDPATGATSRTKDRNARDDCGGSWYDAVGRTVGFLDACARILHLYGADTDTAIDLTAQPGYPRGDDSIDVAAIEGDVVAITVRDKSYTDNLLITVNTRTKAVATLPTPSIRSYTPDDASLMPGPILELADDSKNETLDLYVVADGRTLRTTGIGVYGEPVGHRWAKVGNDFVTANAFEGDYDELVVSVSPSGEVRRQPNPCGGNSGGILPVPGAVLLVCNQYASTGSSITGYGILGIR